MINQPLNSFRWTAFFLFINFMIISLPVLAEPGNPGGSGQTGVLYSGSIPSGDGIVSVKAASGKLYQIPAMSPLGVVQALAGTNSIDSYLIGDELIVKKGILTLDGVNNLTYSGNFCWFVLVNNRDLQDYLLPTEDALNTYQLKSGDVVLYAYGNPTRPLTEAVATMTVTVGSQNGSGNQVSAVNNSVPTQIQTPVPTSAPTQIQTPVPTLAPTQIQTPVPTQALTTPPTPVQTPGPVIQNTTEPVSVVTAVPTTVAPTSTPAGAGDLDKPVYEKSGSTQETIAADSTTTGKDPNKPVYDDGSENGNSESAGSTTTGNDPNKPVYDDGSKNGNSESADSTTTGNDPNKPVYDDGSTADKEDNKNPESGSKESVVSNNEKSTEGTTVPEEETTTIPEPTSKSGSSGQDVLYEGSMSLPSGDVNVTADSGVDYDISATTPLGLLQMLYKDGKISSLYVSDRGMNKGGILTVTGINDYQYGEEGWFAQINENTLQDYLNPGTDGWNLKTFKSGDKVTFYYGKLDQAASTAKAVIYVTID